MKSRIKEPETKLSASEIKEVLAESKSEPVIQNAKRLCKICSSYNCDYCKNALRTGKRVIPSDTV